MMRIAVRCLGLLKPTIPIVDVGEKSIEEVDPLIRDRLERWLIRSRRSTEFFITAIWKHRCG